MILQSTFLLFASSVLAYDCAIKRFVFPGQSRYLAVEILSDSLVHFEYSTTGKAPSPDSPFYVTQMIDVDDFSKRYCGPTVFKKGDNSFETAKLSITLNQNLEPSVYDKVNNKQLTSFGYQNQDNQNVLAWTREQTTSVYGVAAAFGTFELGNPNSNFIGKKYTPVVLGGKSKAFGNVMQNFDTGAASTAQFPIMYAKGDNNYQWSFFFDNVYGQTWDFTQSKFSVSAQGTLRWFVFQGASLKTLRRDYMMLVGAPKVPPKDYFGFQHSLYGFQSFQQMFDNVDATRKANIPQDGMVLDLYWFGGQKEYFGNNDPKNTRFGELSWDEKKFPNPTKNVKHLRDFYNVGVTLIEEPYIGQNTKMYQKLASKYSLVKDSKFGAPTNIDYNPWWGVGGLIDWSSPSSALWHDCRRCPLIQGCVVDQDKCSGLLPANYAADIVGHWIDLGEPEMYNDWQQYYGYHDDQNQWFTDEAANHNIYQLLSSKALFDGYQRAGIERRAASLVRTGTSGIQRYGSGLWSGDISSYLPVLGNHYGAQKQIIMGGIDYYGSDIGGFHRSGVLNRPELARQGITVGVSFTKWLANSVFTDIPVRTHTNQNDCSGHGCPNDMQTNPAWVGDVASNRFNIRTRYELFPYYYSLAHIAHAFYEPIFRPMFLEFENDAKLRANGDQLMIGPYLMVAHHTTYYTNCRNVYFPAGLWYDYRSHEMIVSTGQSFNRSLLYTIPETQTTVFAVPLFVKAGAIIPRTFVDDSTQNNFGVRKDGEVFKTQLVRVWLSNDCTSTFTIAEDDGRSNEYIQENRAFTKVDLETIDETSWKVTFHPTTGSFAGSYESRPYAVEFVMSDVVLNNRDMELTLLVNGEPLPKADTKNSNMYINTRPSFSMIEQGKVIVAFSTEFSVTELKTFVLKLGDIRSSK